MKVLNRVFVLIVSLILQMLFIIPRIVIQITILIEHITTIVRKTLKFLIDTTVEEITK